MSVRNRLRALAGALGVAAMMLAFTPQSAVADVSADSTSTITVTLDASTETGNVTGNYCKIINVGWSGAQPQIPQ